MQPLCFNSADAEFTLAASVKLARGAPTIATVLQTAYQQERDILTTLTSALELSPHSHQTRLSSQCE